VALGMDDTLILKRVLTHPKRSLDRSLMATGLA
jgi:hypothetical protein